MIAELVDMRTDLELVKTALGNALRVGTVAEVDAARGYRLDLGGDNDEAFLSPWLPHPETSKTSVPLEPGQVVGVVSPTGDLRQGLTLRGGYSGDHPSPNADMAANVFAHAGVRVTVGEGVLAIEAGGVTVGVSNAGLVVDGGAVTNDGVPIDATHVHAGVIKGGAMTEPPVV